MSPQLLYLYDKTVYFNGDDCICLQMKEEYKLRKCSTAALP